jgi:hypothetical protein
VMWGGGETQEGRLEAIIAPSHKQPNHCFCPSPVVPQSAKPGLFDTVVPDESPPDVYHALKEAISGLSPIIRSRLRGLPAYVLDYSDLIPPNLVEKPFLKPVVLAGPTVLVEEESGSSGCAAGSDAGAQGEGSDSPAKAVEWAQWGGEGSGMVPRAEFLTRLAAEFPDVFAFPRLTTTRPADVDGCSHALTPRELSAARKLHAAMLAKSRSASGSGGKGGSRSAAPTPLPAVPEGAGEDDDLEDSDEEEWSAADAAALAAAAGRAGAGEGAAGDDPEAAACAAALASGRRPPARSVSPEEFEAAVASGAMMVAQSELFKHERATYRVGVTLDAVREVLGVRVGGQVVSVHPPASVQLV